MVSPKGWSVGSAASSENLHAIRLEINRQPTDETCGPTCLHAVYRYFADPVELGEVVATVPMLGVELGRGTTAAALGCHALGRGYRATLYTFDLNVFDPTWFPAEGEDAAADRDLLLAKLRAQAEAKGSAKPKLAASTRWYTEFLEAGGEVRMRDLSAPLLSGFLRRGVPVLTGLSATYLYRESREHGPADVPDDVRGEPQGHFVVLCGYDAAHRRVRVADPLGDDPPFFARIYEVPMARVVGAIMLGVLTHDANLLVIEPGRPLGGGGAPGESSGPVPRPSAAGARSRHDDGTEASPKGPAAR